MVDSSSDTLPDSPTPVPLPPTGPCSNAVVSSKGDTIELVVHSPTKIALQPGRLPSEWEVAIGGRGNADLGDHATLLSLTDGNERRADTTTAMATSPTPPIAPPSTDDDDVLSVLSASDLMTDPSPSSLRLTAPLLNNPRDSSRYTDSGESKGSRLADAFSERWGAWLGDASDNNDETTGQDNQGQSLHLGGSRGQTARTGGRRAREFDNEALLLSPYNPHSSITVRPANSTGADTPRSSCPSPTSTQAVDDKDWLLGNEASLKHGVSTAPTTVAWTKNPDIIHGEGAGLACLERQPSNAPIVCGATAAAKTSGHGGCNQQNDDGVGAVVDPATTRTSERPRWDRYASSDYGDTSGSSYPTLGDARSDGEAGTAPSTASSRHRRDRRRWLSASTDSVADNDGEESQATTEAFVAVNARQRDARRTKGACSTTHEPEPTHRAETQGYQEEHDSVSPKRFARPSARGSDGGARGNNRSRAGRGLNSGDEIKADSTEDRVAAILRREKSTARWSAPQPGGEFKEIDL